MKASLSLMLAGLYAAAAPWAPASYQTGAVDLLDVRDSDGLLWVDLGGPGGLTGRALCAANTTYWIIPNETTETGRRLFASLRTAMIAGREVTIHGKGTCGRWPDGEDIEYVDFWGPNGHS